MRLKSSLELLVVALSSKATVYIYITSPLYSRVSFLCFVFAKKSQWCCACLDLFVLGLTETLGGTALGFPDEMCMLGTVGIPAVYNEIRLEEVAEMGYDPLGEIQAGEICIRGTCLFSGYYKNPELTQEVMKNGWFHTGD